jgi:uncharacterized protein YndB with AHSA1/START domain
MKATPDSSDSLVFECDLEEPPEKVWRALTEPALLAAWLSTAAGGPAQPGSSEYEILTAEPHRFLRYRWRDRESADGEPAGREVHSVVTMELAPCPAGGTHLRLTHGEFSLVTIAPVMTATRIVPITSARRRRTPIVSCAARACLRRAA